MSFARGLAVRPVFLLLSLAGLVPSLSRGQDRPHPVLPDTVPYVAVTHTPGAETKWLVGAGDKAGLYMFRNRFAPGTKAQPHSHPDTRFTYVLSGTLYVGFGRTFDPTKMRAIPTGAVYVAPARIPHFVWAKDGEVVFQETGLGPTATDFVERRPP